MKKNSLPVSSKSEHLLINLKVYPLEVIMNTCFIFIDKYYIYLDETEEGKIKVELKPKNTYLKKKWEEVSGEFYNELLNQAIRKSINLQNAKLREYIISKALFSADLIREFNDLNLEEENGIEDIDEDYLDDPLQIAVPWEEKYGKNKKNNGN